MTDLVQVLLDSFSKEKGVIPLCAITDNSLLVYWEGRHYVLEVRMTDARLLNVYLKFDFHFVQSAPIEVEKAWQKVWTDGLEEHLERTEKAGNADLLPDCMKTALRRRLNDLPSPIH